MRYLALATDYDGTLATDGVVFPETRKTLQNLRHSGRKLIMVTGRELPDLESVFPYLDLFDVIVAENGGLLYWPGSREKRILAQPPIPAFVDKLRERGVGPISVGEVIIATWRPHENTVLDVIRDLGLELQVIFNKDAVMILPPGVNKMFGLNAALCELGLSEHNVVGVGDAENDHAFLTFCECSVAVANAIPSIKEAADLTTQADHGAGVVHLIEMILDDDLAAQDQKFQRRRIPVGHEGDEEISIRPYNGSILVSGASGSGKSTLTAGLLEAIMERKYQVCLIDPEGDYEAFAGMVTIGDERHPPSLDQILQSLEKPGAQVVVNMIGVQLADRPAFFATLLPRLQEMRLRTGRPHWLVIDEAHHMLHAGWAPASAELAGELKNIILITVHPEHVAPSALQAVDVMFAVGTAARDVVKEFAETIGVPEPHVQSKEVDLRKALVWFRETDALRQIDLLPPKVERKRHKRKYAYGELDPDRSFFFKGTKGQLNLRAQNLMVFLQLAEGIDDETWNYHLRQGDYSKWFREGIKDEDLSKEVTQVEENAALNPRESRELVKKAIEQRYTAPA